MGEGRFEPKRLCWKLQKVSIEIQGSRRKRISNKEV